MSEVMAVGAALISHGAVHLNSRAACTMSYRSLAKQDAALEWEDGSITRCAYEQQQ